MDRKEYSRRYRLADPERTRAQRKEYRLKRLDKINAYDKSRKAADPAFKLMTNLRVRHSHVIKGEQSTTKGLGCNSRFFKDYISKQWTEGMNWDNYGFGEGKWNIDHIKPLSLYYENPESLPELVHYTNMQPMWHMENLKKGKKIIQEKVARTV